MLCANCHREAHSKDNSQYLENQLLKQKISDELIKQICEYYLNNEITINKLSVKYNISRALISNILKNNNINIYHHSQKIKSKNIPQKEVLEVLIWNRPAIDIAKQFGVSDKAVEKWCKKYNIKKPGRGYWAKKQSKANYDN